MKNLNTANKVTILRILLLIPFVSCMLKINDPAISPLFQDVLRYMSIAVFAAMAASDVLDGYLARKKGQCTQLGAFLDPMADKLLMLCACLLLASERSGIPNFRLPSTVVVLIVGKDIFLLLGFLVVYFTTTESKVIPAPIGKLATSLQISMVAAILLAPEISQILPGWIWVLRVLWWSAATTALIATLIYIRMGSGYVEHEQHPAKEQNH
jgi:CDP-diacylglycerol--glycerol-3-phosphate 3-phosphatidyltransferase